MPVISQSIREQSVNPGSTLHAFAKADIEASKVWAVLVPPQSDDNDGQPVTDLPEFPMNLNQATGNYEATITGFDQAGVYQLSFYAQANDEAGFISLPRTVKIAAFPSQGQVSIEQIETLFDWAETTFPELFNPANQVTKDIVGYIARYYPGSQMYLATK